MSGRILAVGESGVEEALQRARRKPKRKVRNARCIVMFVLFGDWYIENSSEFCQCLEGRHYEKEIILLNFCLHLYMMDSRQISLLSVGAQNDALISIDPLKFRSHVT